MNASGEILRVCAQTYPQFLWISTSTFDGSNEDDDSVRYDYPIVYFAKIFFIVLYDSSIPLYWAFGYYKLDFQN